MSDLIKKGPLYNEVGSHPLQEFTLFSVVLLCYGFREKSVQRLNLHVPNRVELERKLRKQQMLDEKYACVR